MRKTSVLIHGAGWLTLYFFWVMVFQKRELAFSQTVTVEFCYLLFISANFYFNMYVNIPYFLNKKRYVIFMTLFIGGIAVASFLRAPLAMFLNSRVFIPGSQPDFLTVLQNSFLNISVWVIGMVAARMLIDRFKILQRFDELQKQKEQAELSFLNAQFNPHFIFNSINSIYGQIDKQNAPARKMLLTFSDMLRYQLYECNEPQIAIAKELDYIDNYINLQRVRKNSNLKLTFVVDKEVKGFMISPLLFVTFIENSFKHCGSGEEPGDFIAITFEKADDVLMFTCVNSKGQKPTSIEDRKGIGLSNARRRLDLLYPSTHELVVNETDLLFQVTLKLKVDEA